MMFNHDYGFGPGKWLKWFMGLIIVAAILSAFPESELAVKIGAVFAAVAMGILWHKIKQLRSGK